MHKVLGKENVADIGTKALDQGTLSKLVKLLPIHRPAREGLEDKDWGKMNLEDVD